MLAWLDVCRNGWPVNSKDARLGTDRTLDALDRRVLTVNWSDAMEAGMLDFTVAVAASWSTEPQIACDDVSKAIYLAGSKSLAGVLTWSWLATA